MKILDVYFGLKGGISCWQEYMLESDEEMVVFWGERFEIEPSAGLGDSDWNFVRKW